MKSYEILVCCTVQQCTVDQTLQRISFYQKSFRGLLSLFILKPWYGA